MIIASNPSLLKTQEYFNKITSVTNQTKNRKSVFAFAEGLYDLQLWDKICCWILIPEKNTGISSKVISLGGLSPAVHSIGNSLTWDEYGVSFNGTSSFIDTNLNPLAVGCETNNTCLFVDVVSAGIDTTIGALQAADSQLCLDVRTNGPVSFSCFHENSTYTTNISGSNGFWLASNTLSGSFIQKNGVIQTTTSTEFYVETAPNRNLFIGCHNGDSNQPIRFTEQKISFAGIVKGIDQSSASQLFELYQNFKNSIYPLRSNIQILVTQTPTSTGPTVTTTPATTPTNTLTSTVTPTPTITQTPTSTPTTTPTTTPTNTPTTTGGLSATPTPTSTGPTATPTATSQTFSFNLTGPENIDEANKISITSPDPYLFADTVYYNTGGSIAAVYSMELYINGEFRSLIDFYTGHLGRPFGYRTAGSIGTGPQFSGTFANGRIDL
jgi:hypothetical protein